MPTNPLALRHEGSDPLKYEIEVARNLKKSHYMDSSINSNDVIDGNSAHGVVEAQTDAYKFDGPKRRVALEDAERWELAVDDRGWIDARKFAEVEELGSGDDSKDYNKPDNQGGSNDQEPIPDGDNVVPVSGKHDLPPSAETPRYGMVSRPYYSTGDIEIYVEKGREVESLQEAFNLIPHYVYHEVRIHVMGETKDRNTAHLPPQIAVGSVPHVIIEGADGATINRGGTNVSAYAKADHIVHQNYKTEMLSQCIFGRYVDIDMGGNGKAAFSGKMGCKMLVNCDIGNGNDTYGVWSIGGENVEIRGGSVHAKEAAVRGAASSIHSFNAGPNIDVPGGTKMDGGGGERYIGGVRVD